MATNQEAYKQGYIDGLTCMAWWKDGVQYVGSCGTTLKEAIAEAEKGLPWNYIPPKETE